MAVECIVYISLFIYIEHISFFATWFVMAWSFLIDNDRPFSYGERTVPVIFPGGIMSHNKLSAVFALLCMAVGTSACIMAQSPALPQSSAQKSNLTAGMVKKYVKVGKATQADLLTVFGAPNIITRDRDGNEVWTYDRQSMASVSEIAAWNAGGSVTVAGAGLAGSTPVGGVASGGGSAGKSSNTGQVSSATFTLMLTFGANDVVKDYRMMATQF